MLNGVGGRTIAEAQDRLSYPEFLLWTKYRQRRGGLNPGMRTEVAFARLASLYINTKLKADVTPSTFFDFAPHFDRPVIELDEAMEKWV